MQASGIGKALVAEFSDRRAMDIVDQMGLPRLSDGTITDGVALKETLAKSGLQGHSCGDEECTQGMRCVTAAVFDQSKPGSLEGWPWAGRALSVSSHDCARGSEVERQIHQKRLWKNGAIDLI